MQTLAISLGIVGAALVITGALLAYLGGSREDPKGSGLYSIPRFGAVSLFIAVLGALVGLAATFVGISL